MMDIVVIFYWLIRSVVVVLVVHLTNDVLRLPKVLEIFLKMAECCKFPVFVNDATGLISILLLSD